MNYYKRHLGDYARDTGHLTALEHGIYGLLLDWYYANEKPIPADKAVRIARGNPDETQSVLSEFFKLTPEGWRHSYADRVIREYNAKADRNREVGKLGGRPSKTQTVPKENPKETLATSHKPVTIIKEEAKATVQPAAALSRFDEFWKEYPNKKGRKDAERHWKREKCEPIADALMAHVRMMQAQDADWQRGAVPMGSTYLNGRRWEDQPKAQTNGHAAIHVTAPSPAKIGAAAALERSESKLENAISFAHQQFALDGDRETRDGRIRDAQARYG